MFFNLLYRLYARITWFFYRVSTCKKNLWKLWFPELTYEYFFWDRDGQYTDTSCLIVPRHAFHIEQWTRNDGHVRRYVIHESNPIRFYEGDPFAPVRTPWLWIGNPHDNDIDVTAQLEAYQVPGNCITPKLIQKVTGLQEPHYMDPRSLDVVKFPEQGIVLERDDAI